MKCPSCGAEVKEGRFCIFCGSELPIQNTPIKIVYNNNSVTNNNISYTKPMTAQEVYDDEVIREQARVDQQRKRIAVARQAEARSRFIATIIVFYYLLGVSYIFEAVLRIK